VLSGQASGTPRIAGRVNALAVHPDGERVYAASGNGGVWYSSDGGGHWRSLGGLAPTDTTGINRPAQRHACGAILVDFGATEADDDVWVGTGEVTHDPDAQPGSSLGGLGILVAHGPAASTLPNPWTREAKNLIGNGVNRIVREPGGSTVIAATRTGLFQRPAAPGVDADWVRPAGTPFDTLKVECTDALWTAGDTTTGRPARLWVWVKDDGQAGLWVRAAGATDFSKVVTPVKSRPVPAPANPPTLRSRSVLAASNPPDQVWLLNDQGTASPVLLRIACAGAAAPVATQVTAGVPALLSDQGHYDIAIAVDPSNANRVALGGCNLDTTTPDLAVISGDGAITVADVALNGLVLTYGQPNAYTMVGVGVHSDIHDVKYSNNGARLWTACDGGVFRSDHPAQMAGFYACNNGLSIVESNYVAVHPDCEGHIVTGLQDNAVITRLSNGVWKLAGEGDGGGVVLDPMRPDRFLRQHYRGYWSSSDGTVKAKAMLKRGGAFAKKEFKASAFYSSAAAIAHRRGAPAPNIGQIIVGTTRLWYTENFGANWVTLPSGTDPLPGDQSKQDSFGQAVTVCRWQSPDVAWVLGESKLMRYARTPGSDNAGGPGAWTRETIKDKPTGSSPDPLEPDSKVWTDIAVNLDAGGVQHGSKGALYLGTIGNPDKADVDTLWWYDGTSKWFKTGLRSDATGVPAPVTAIVCDPAFPEEVYVGTTVGVWKGLRTQIGDAVPAWTWSRRLNGLPEAAVEDLQIFSDGTLRLLRAAIAARGVWELRLDTADLADLTYLRAHDDDLRMRPDAVGTQRDRKTPRSWHGSPDVRPRTKSVSAPAPASLPWTRHLSFSDNEELRRFQAALAARIRPTGDRRVRATGEWDLYFNEVLRNLGAPLMPPPAAPNTVCIDSNFWDAQMLDPAHASAEPWISGNPTEADLLELTAPLTEGDLARAACWLPPRASKVDILVHHRGLDARDGGEVRVTLLKWIDPKKKNAAKWDDSNTWATDPVPWTAAVNEVLNSGNGATTKTFAAGWSFIGTTNATRRQTLTGQTLDPTRSGIATFDLNLTGLKHNTVVVLVAVMRAGGAGDDIALTADSLKNLAMKRPEVAVRSIRIVI
jgi:hypothetical protein